MTVYPNFNEKQLATLYKTSIELQCSILVASNNYRDITELRPNQNLWISLICIFVPLLRLITSHFVFSVRQKGEKKEGERELINSSILN